MKWWNVAFENRSNCVVAFWEIVCPGVASKVVADADGRFIRLTTEPIDWQAGASGLTVRSISCKVVVAQAGTYDAIYIILYVGASPQSMKNSKNM